MNKQNSFKLNKLYAVVVLLSAQNAFAAANFNIAPYGTLPTTPGPAYFTLTNMTNTARNGYVLQGLPATVTQNTTPPNCTNPINLGPNDYCMLQLDITGAVSLSNVAICKGNSCTTLGVPLNVSGGSGSKIIFGTNWHGTGNLIANAQAAPFDAPTGLTGIQSADYICNHDTNKTGTGTYKALIVDGSTRTTTTNWVIANGVTYINQDASTIGVGQSDGSITFSGTFQVQGLGNTTTNMWTGGPGSPFCSTGVGVSWNTSSTSFGGGQGLGNGATVWSGSGNGLFYDSSLSPLGSGICGVIDPSLGGNSSLACVQQ